MRKCIAAAHAILRRVPKGMGRVRRNVNGFSRAYDGFFAAKGGFDFAFEDGEGFLKVMPMRTRASAWRNQHIDKAIAAIGVVAR